MVSNTADSSNEPWLLALASPATMRIVLPVLLAGLLLGFGALALVRGLHVYVDFYSFASGIATRRLHQTFLWSGLGGISIAAGIATLVGSVGSA